METLIGWLEATPIWLPAVALFGLFAAAVQVGRVLGRLQGLRADEGDPGLLVSASLG